MHRMPALRAIAFVLCVRHGGLVVRGQTQPVGHQGRRSPEDTRFRHTRDAFEKVTPSGRRTITLGQRAGKVADAAAHRLAVVAMADPIVRQVVDERIRDVTDKG